MPPTISTVLKRLLCLLIIHVIYTFCGALVLIGIEECRGKEHVNSKYTGFIKHIDELQELNETEKMILKKISNTVSKHKTACSFGRASIMKWWEFTTVSCAAIGYGNITPKTKAGKLTTIVFSLFGISWTMALVMIVGENLALFINYVLKKIATKCLKHSDEHVEGCINGPQQMLLTFFFFCITIALGSVVIMGTNDQQLPYLDSVYFTFQTITTIGYGDIEWHSQHSILSIVFPFILSLLGLGMIASVYSNFEIQTEKNDENVSSTEQNSNLRNVAENNGYSSNSDGDNSTTTREVNV